MNKKERLNKLFSDWKSTERHSTGKFIIDGAIDIEKWERVDRKVLFLAKEAYGFDVDSDFCDFILKEWRKEPKYKMLRTLGYWAYGLQNSTKNKIPSIPVDESKIEQVKNALFSSAIVNIKKSHGESSSKDRDLIIYWDADRDLLREEIEILDPDIVVCCSTFSLVSGYLWPKMKTIELKVYRNGNRWIIDYWHPSNRYPHILNYYTLCALAQQAKILG